MSEKCWKSKIMSVSSWCDFSTLIPMAVKVRFLLLVDKKHKGDATIYARLTDGRKADVKFSIGFSVNPAYWDNKSGKIRDDVMVASEADREYTRAVTDHLTKIKTRLIQDYDKFPGDKYSREEAAAVVDEYRRSLQVRQGAIPTDVIGYLEYFLAGIKEGTIKYKGRNYDPNTCKVWSNFTGIIRRFHEKRSFAWEDIDKRLYDRFVRFMEDEGYMLKSINKYVICFRAIIGYALADKVHNNTSAKEVFYKQAVKEADKSAEIYLTAEEVEALYQMELEGLRGIIRDVFLCGVYTCQRFSDYSRIAKENFSVTAKGTKVVRLEQEKTGNSVIIPVLNDNLIRIVERYDHDLPQVNDVVLNRYIKEILKELSLRVPSLAEKRRTVLTMKERAKEARGDVKFERDRKENVIKSRYDLVSSHTARRTGITNLYLSGMFDNLQMMSISGHKDTATFLDYIKLSGDEIADRINSKLQDQKAKNEGLF